MLCRPLGAARQRRPVHDLETLRFRKSVFSTSRFQGKYAPNEGRGVAMMPCSYRYYVRPHRVGAPPARPLTVKREEAAAPPPAPESQTPHVIDTPPHVALVRQYAW